jgi:GST-like protein
VSKWSGARPHLRDNRPEFLATLERIEAYPPIAAVYARHWPPT